MWYVYASNGTAVAITSRNRTNAPWCAEVEDRLAVVIAQEEEVRAIADEHLEREDHLTKLLEDLYRQQKVGCNRLRLAMEWQRHNRTVWSCMLVPGTIRRHRVCCFCCCCR